MQRKQIETAQGSGQFPRPPLHMPQPMPGAHSRPSSSAAQLPIRAKAAFAKESAQLWGMKLTWTWDDI